MAGNTPRAQPLAQALNQLCTAVSNHFGGKTFKNFIPFLPKEDISSTSVQYWPYWRIRHWQGEFLWSPQQNVQGLLINVTVGQKQVKLQK
jgi:hypothetical protein